MTLIEQVKRKLNITWNDEETDKRINDIIASAVLVLKHKLGIADADFDFSAPGLENLLFLAYCLYEWNHAAHEFDSNYANELAQCRAIREVSYHVEHENDGDAYAE